SGGGGSGGGGSGGSTGTPFPTNCGDGVVDEALGEDCDDRNADNTDGCTAGCRFTCTRDVDEGACSNGVFCDGEERCNANHRCEASPALLPDGTICGQTHICRGGLCSLADANCGDGLVVPPLEECEDGNEVDGDGCDSCRWTCISTDPERDCSTGDPCEGQPRCDNTRHRCVPGTPLSDLTPCGDGNVCFGGRCVAEYCGNGKTEAAAGEECDDGNRTDGDGCDDCKFSCVASDPTRDCRSTQPCFEDGVCNPSTHRCSARLPKVAGSACGPGLNCVAGNCRAVACGDGVQALGAEVCDDGNRADGDTCKNNCTVGCSNASTDCRDAPACRAPSCAALTCSSAPDVSQEGEPCDTGAGQATCKGGACTSGTCGDGVKQPGEQCDLGASGNGVNTGCERDCTLSCQQGADCTDSDPCNGTETCSSASQSCVQGAPLPDGAACGGGRICLAGGCRTSLCGDGYTNLVAGEECEPPNTAGCTATCKALERCDPSGTWALKITVDVTWGDDEVIAVGTGQIIQWVRLVTTQPTPGSFSVDSTIATCGVQIPDFQSGQLTGGEWFGLEFPAPAAFDSGGFVPSATQAVFGSLSPGATFRSVSAATLLGLDMQNPFGPWPTSTDDLLAATGITVTDADGDGKLGLTTVAKSGAKDQSSSYMAPIVDVENFPTSIGRASKLYLVIRQITALDGVLDSCNALSGTANVGSIDVHVVGCERDTGEECSVPNRQIADAVRPIHSVVAATFEMRRMSAGATACADVRSLLP
ncbi:MAG: DUF4215 domain-containing protein, partial [Deltaproteobacteria bacterium]|nr:DUF4215 domain-containing protein [Deltaproteobacteria bacterium]